MAEFVYTISYKPQCTVHEKDLANNNNNTTTTTTTTTNNNKETRSGSLSPQHGASSGCGWRRSVSIYRYY
jgi:hypothetical protein